MNDGLQAVIKINRYIIKRSNYDIFIVFSLGNKDQPLRSFTPVKIICCRKFEFLKYQRLISMMASLSE